MDTNNEVVVDPAIKRFLAEAKDSLLSGGTYERHLTPYELQSMKPYNARDYLRLLAFETAEYTAPDAWAHTEPARRVICILPPGRRDPYLPIGEHEILHNLFPEAPEEAIHSMAFNKSCAAEARARAIIEYR